MRLHRNLSKKVKMRKTTLSAGMALHSHIADLGREDFRSLKDFGSLNGPFAPRTQRTSHSTHLALNALSHSTHFALTALPHLPDT